MLDTLQNSVIVVVCVLCALSCMAAVNYIWPTSQRKIHNDLIGWQLSVLGTTYAVIIGFMLYTVWTNYGSAELNAEAEANSITNLYRLADGLPVAQSGRVKSLTRDYVDAVVNHEWTEMALGQSPDETRKIIARLWETLAKPPNASPSEVTAGDHALYELSALSGYRRIRMVANGTNLPGVLWFVLLVGAAVTVASTCLFGASNSYLHGIQVGAFSLLISLALVAIADINRPYQGSVHISDYPFRRALEDIK
jgi:hypothetical protein